MKNFDFTNLASTEHMLKWLANEPYKVILENITNMLTQQVASSTIQLFKVTTEPEWLTGLLPVEGQQEKGILIRAGCAFEFLMEVQAPDQMHTLKGSYTWVGVYLNDPKKHSQKTWLDLDKTLLEIGAQGLLKQRIYFEKSN